MVKALFRQALKTALIKDGWTITSDPLTIRIDRVKLEIDLAAEKVFAAEKDGQKIAVEVKSFINPSNISDFHKASCGEVIALPYSIHQRALGKTCPGIHCLD